jgi:WD40 repeat protein
MGKRRRRPARSTVAGRYDAFISYSHAADGRLAPALQAGLQRLAKPWYRPRALRVFRDDTGLAVNPALWDSISSALEASRFFVVLVSPEAAASPWVNREIEHWVTKKGPGAILPVLTDGTLAWDPAKGDYDPERSTALPPALVGRFGDEARHLDLRWARGEDDLDLRHSLFRAAVADLAAPLHGVPKDELEGEDIRLHRRGRRLARGAVAGLAVLLVASLIAGGLAVANARQANRQSERAEHEAAIAKARGLAGEAAARASSAPDLALLLALEAHRLDDSVESRGALLTALEQTTRLRRIVTGFPADETVVGLSDDGRTFALTDPRGRVRVVDVDTRDSKASFDTGQRGPVDVVFSADGELMATTSEDSTVRLWDTRNQQARSSVLRGHEWPVRTAAFSGDGEFLATADSGGQVLLWDAAAGRLVSRPPPTFVLPVFGMDFSPDATRLALSGIATRVFSVADGGQSVATEFTLDGPSHAVAFSGDGALIAVARADDRLVDVWDVASRQRLHSFRPPEAVDDSALSFAVSFSQDGGTVAAGNADGTTVAWDLESDRLVGPPLVGLRGAAEHVTIGANASHVTTASATGVASWDLQGTALSTRQDTDHSLESDSVAFSPDGHHVATIDMEGLLSIRDAVTLRPQGDPVPTAAPKCCYPVAAFSPDGRSVVGGVGDHLSSVDVRAGAVDRPPLDMGAEVSDLDFSRDGRLLAVGVGNGTVAIVDVQRWSVRRRGVVSGREAGVSRSSDFANQGRSVGVALSPDGMLVASVGNEGRVLLEDVDGDNRTVLAEGKGPAYALDFSSDGRSLAAGLADGTTLLIDIERGPTGSVALVGHAGYIWDLAFSPDDDLLAVASFSGVTLWDVASRERIGELVGRALPYKLAFSPDGLSLATTWYDNSLIVWELDVRTWVRRACEIAGRNLTRTEWAQSLGAEPYRRTCSEWPEG